MDVVMNNKCTQYVQYIQYIIHIVYTKYTNYMHAIHHTYSYWKKNPVFAWIEVGKQLIKLKEIRRKYLQILSVFM